jgi:hypothetical protein
MEKFPNPNKLSHDLLLAVLIASLVCLTSVQFQFQQMITAEQLGLFITIFIGIAGVLVTILTILFAFEQNFSKNRAVLILKKREEYPQLYKRFIDSTFSLFYSTIFLSAVYIFFSKSIIQTNIAFVSFFAYVVIIFGFVRIYRAFYLFKIYHDVISTYQQKE